MKKEKRKGNNDAHVFQLKHPPIENFQKRTKKENSKKKAHKKVSTRCFSKGRRKFPAKNDEKGIANKKKNARVSKSIPTAQIKVSILSKYAGGIS